MKLELGQIIEKGIDRLMHPQSGIATSTIRSAYDAFSPHGLNHNNAIRVGDKRIGREYVKTTLHSDGVHRHHYVFYYDWPDQENPNLRWGVEGEGNKVRLYSAQDTNGEQLIEYYGRLSTDEAMNYIRLMPRGNGNLIGLNGLR